MSPAYYVLATLGLLADDAPKPRTLHEPVVVHCQIEGRTMILSVLPDGSRVHKGDTVCELDASSFRDRLLDQQLAMLQAQRELGDAKHKRFAAEEACKRARKKSVLEGQATAGEVALARSDLELAEDRFKWMKIENESLKTMGSVSQDQRAKDRETAAKKAKATYEMTRIKAEIRDQLLQQGLPKLKEEAALASATEEEKLKEVEYSTQMILVKKLERKILDSMIQAPCEGTVRLANRKTGKPGPALIEDGAMVRERQKLLTIEPD